MFPMIRGKQNNEKLCQTFFEGTSFILMDFWMYPHLHPYRIPFAFPSIMGTNASEVAVYKKTPRWANFFLRSFQELQNILCLGSRTRNHDDAFFSNAICSISKNNRITESKSCIVATPWKRLNSGFLPSTHADIAYCWHDISRKEYGTSSSFWTIFGMYLYETYPSGNTVQFIHFFSRSSTMMKDKVDNVLRMIGLTLIYWNIHQ